MVRFTAFLPAALLLLFGGWLGTFRGSAFGANALFGHGVLLLMAAAAGGAWSDPLRLGRLGRFLVPLLWLVVVLSWQSSPVPRAGRLAAVLLPAFVLATAAASRCWRDASRRRLGLVGVTCAYGVVSLWSLLAWRLLPTPGTSLPLGHHNLLAAWLVAVGPLAFLPFRQGGAARALALGAVALGAAALIASSSLSGFLALLLVLGIAFGGRLRPRWRAVGLVVMVLLLAPWLPRLGSILGGKDASMLARQAYYQAAWRGATERPILGWGPGSAAWTSAEHLIPRPGVHPSDQIVADFHSLPLQILYELGAVGCVFLCLLAWAFLRRRSGKLRDPGLRRAAGLGLFGLGVAGLGGLPLSVIALPVAGVVLAAAWLVGGPAAPPSGRGALFPYLYALIASWLLLPLDWAHLEYDRAVRSGDPRLRSEHLERAVRLDPSFPLYGARSSWREGSTRAAARGARTAAEQAFGIGALWLVAGRLGTESGEPWAADALIRSCNLSPFGAVAPFLLTLERPHDAAVGDWAARALLAEPRLLGAERWQDQWGMVLEGGRRLEFQRGLEIGWRAALVAELERGREPSPAALVLTMDEQPATSLSLFAFRRSPWPAELVRVEMSAEPFAGQRLPAAIDLATTDPALFGRIGCKLLE